MRVFGNANGKNPGDREKLLMWIEGRQCARLV